MPKPAPRQTRLGESDDADAAGLARWANFHVLPRPFLSATALASYSYCPTRPFLERVVSALGLTRDSPQMRAGAQAHEELQSALTAAATPSVLTLQQALEKGVFLFEVERGLKDDSRKLRGVADIVFVSGGEAHLLELKNAFGPSGPDPVWGAPVWREHGLQLSLYGLLAQRELGRRPRLALAYLKGVPKAQVLARLAETHDAESALLDLWESAVILESDARTDAIIEAAVQAFRAAERGLAIPRPDHDDPQRCQRCPVRFWCPRRLDEPGRFEALDARRLEIRP